MSKRRNHGGLQGACGLEAVKGARTVPELAAEYLAQILDRSVMNSVYGLWPMRVSATVTH